MFSVYINNNFRAYICSDDYYIFTSQQKKRYKDCFKYIFMLKPKLLFIINYVNVCVKSDYPHKINNNILFRDGKIQEVNFPSHGRVCDNRIRHLNHMRSLIVLSTNVNNLPFWKFEFSKKCRYHDSSKWPWASGGYGSGWNYSPGRSRPL